jgi:hypothetical protein
VPLPGTFFAIFFSLAANFCKAGKITTKLSHEIRSRKSPKNPPSTTLPKNTNKTPKNLQQNTNNHQKSPSFPHEIKSRKSPKNPPSTHITKKDQQNTKKYQQSPKINNNHKKLTTKTKNTNCQIRELKETEGKKKIKNKTSKNLKKRWKTPPWLHRRRAMTLRTLAPSSTTALSQNRSSSLSLPFHLPVYVKKKKKRVDKKERHLCKGKRGRRKKKEEENEKKSQRGREEMKKREEEMKR